MISATGTTPEVLLVLAGQQFHFLPESIVTQHQTGVEGSATGSDQLHWKLLREEATIGSPCCRRCNTHCQAFRVRLAQFALRPDACPR